MKKMIIACFLAILMLMIPVTSAVKTAEISDNLNISSKNMETPLFYISKNDYLGINSYIELKFQDDEAKKTQAYQIRDEIISSTSSEKEYEIDPVKLAEALITYTGIQPIPEDELTISNIKTIDELNQLIETYWKVKDGVLIQGLFAELIDKIIQIIKDRLGWIYELADRSYNLFIESINLVYNFIQPAAVAIAVLVAQIVNNLIAVPQLFRDLIKNLFSLDFDLFVKNIEDFSKNLAVNVSALIQTAIDLVNNQQIKNYLTSIQGFINWLGGKPWEDKILVTGVVRYNLGYLSGGTVTSRGVSATTDSDGRFSFYVNPSNTDNSSFPPNQWYGMHDCTITVSKDGEVLKQSRVLLSYVFSGGKIEWPFAIIKNKPRNINIRENLMDIFTNLLHRIQALFPNLFRNINRLNMPLT